MVMMAQPIFSAFDARFEQRPYTVFMSPRGRVLDQAKLRELSKHPRLAVICGHYEGVDQRVIDSLVDEEISIGDYVLTGGELAAMVLVDSMIRFIPGVVGNTDVHVEESFENGLLEYPQYTRPAVWHGREIPAILTSGNHEKVRQWRRKQSLRRTRERRPDMYEKLDLSSKQDKKLLKEMDAEDAQQNM